MVVRETPPSKAAISATVRSPALYRSRACLTCAGVSWTGARRCGHGRRGGQALVGAFYDQLALEPSDRGEHDKWHRTDHRG
jgi:hypothetical protein